MRDDVEQTADPASDDTVPRPRRWPVIVGGLALVGLAAAAVAWGVAQRGDAVDAQRQLDRERSAVLVASGFVEALMSYDFEDLDRQQAAVEQFATDEFRADFSDAFSDEVRDEIVAEEASATVGIEGVYVDVGGGEELSVIVHAISDVASGGGATAELESYLRVRLVRLGGRWLVDDLTSLGSRDLSAPLPQPDATAEDAG